MDWFTRGAGPAHRRDHPQRRTVRLHPGAPGRHRALLPLPGPGAGPAHDPGARRSWPGRRSRDPVWPAEPGGLPAVAPGDGLLVRTDWRFSHETVTNLAAAMLDMFLAEQAPFHDPARILAFRDHLTLAGRFPARTGASPASWTWPGGSRRSRTPSAPPTASALHKGGRTAAPPRASATWSWPSATCCRARWWWAPTPTPATAAPWAPWPSGWTPPTWPTPG